MKRLSILASVALALLVSACATQSSQPDLAPRPHAERNDERARQNLGQPPI